MKKCLFFFLLISIMVCKVYASEIEIGFLDGNNIILDGSSDYETEMLNYISKDNKIILNNANLNYISVNGSIKERLLVELNGDNYITNDDGYGIENYNSDLILEGSGKLFIKTKVASAVYMEESNMYVRANGDFESKVTNTIHIKKGELIIEKNADLKVKSDGAQGIYIEPGLMEVNDAKLNVISASDPIAVLNKHKPYYFFNARIKTSNVKQKNSVFGDYNKYTIGYVHDIEISSDDTNSNLITYKLKLGDVFNGSIIPSKNEYIYGERIDYEIIPNRGYLYKENSISFLEDFMLTNANSEVRMLDIGLTITCEFEEKHGYTVNLFYNEGGSFDKENKTLMYDGEDYILNIETNSGYEIKSIKVNDELVSNNNSIIISNINRDYDIYVEFENNNIQEEYTQVKINNEIEEITNPKTNDGIKIHEILLIISLTICSIPVFFEIKNKNIK